MTKDHKISKLLAREADLRDSMISAGRGYERVSETRTAAAHGDPLASAYVAAIDAVSNAVKTLYAQTSSRRPSRNEIDRTAIYASRGGCTFGARAE